MRNVRRMAAGMGMAVFLAMAADVQAHEGAKHMTGPAKARHDAMITIKEHFVPLVKMVKGAIPFDAAAVRKNAEVLARKLEEASKLFPEGSDQGETRAKPEIWLLYDEFQGLFKTAIEKAKALMRVQKPEELAPAVMALGAQGCQACHEKFRAPKGK